MRKTEPNIIGVPQKYNSSAQGQKPGQKEVIFIIPYMEGIGELSNQMFQLRNLYCDEDKYKLTMITLPFEPRVRTHCVGGVNKAVYKIVMRGVNVVHSLDQNLTNASSVHRLYQSIITEPGRVYVLLKHSYMARTFLKKYYRKKPMYHFSLTRSEHEMGKQLRDKFGIPEAAPIVTVHAREPGYYPGDIHYNERRDAKIENYIPAINHLIDKGFYVVRIGDRSMKRIINGPHQLIDAPFHPDYTDFVDPYFLAESKFFIGSNSGPVMLALGFGTPTLVTNVSVIPEIWLTDNDLLLYKTIYSHQLKRNLTYEEMLLSPFMDYLDTRHFKKAGVEHIDNSPEEILMATKEMLGRLNGTYQEDEKLNERVRKIHEKAHCVRRHLAPMRNPYAPFIFMAACNSKISHEYIKLNPHFLGHEWLGEDPTIQNVSPI